MRSRNTIENELRSLHSGLPVTQSPSFSVPEGYFENLAETILARIKSSETLAVQAELTSVAPLLADIPKRTPYSVPSSYFVENLQNLVTDGAEPELPLLTSVGKVMPYDFPRGYFDALPERMLADVKEQPTGKVLPMFRRAWAKMAAAAVIAGGLIFGGLQVFTHGTTQDGLTGKIVDTTPMPLAKNGAPIQQDIKKVSTKELEDFIANVPATPLASAKTKVSEKDAVDMLKDVSVNEMESFLAAVPQSDDELTATDEP